MQKILPMDIFCFRSSLIPRLPQLPAEIQDQIIKHLPYPDLLSLKLTNSYFYNTIETTVHDRADWLLDRAQRNLPIPRQSNCLLRSDVEFCSHPEVLQILRWRRKHLGCREPDSSCREVLGVGWRHRWISSGRQQCIWQRLGRATSDLMSALGTRVSSTVPSSTNIWCAVLGALIATLILELEVTPNAFY